MHVTATQTCGNHAMHTSVSVPSTLNAQGLASFLQPETAFSDKSYQNPTRSGVSGCGVNESPQRMCGKLSPDGREGTLKEMFRA